ncbi:hypothetical protein CEV31_0909 [Brucella thiophenivorans]|uniref:Uncharacterized protein n=1 Tax=Brucella thiophenivorans TaxID=571255 RepID=A0A256G0K0_9HYPH|nr:hypothetical protein CEV31_0909 [Brucella thiophenivorans]
MDEASLRPCRAKPGSLLSRQKNALVANPVIAIPDLGPLFLMTYGAIF